jgi:hypothetical protein
MSYLIWCPGRCGSVLASTIIKLAYNKQNNNFFEISMNLHHREILENKGIVHCHNLRCFVDNAKNHQSVVVTRNSFDSVISRMISEMTDSWTIRTKFDLRKYHYSNKDRTFELNVDKFQKLVLFNESQYSTLLKCTTPNLVIDYEDFKDNFQNLLTPLNLRLDVTPDVLLKLPIKTPVDKITQVINYTQLQEVYKSLVAKNFYLK